MTAITKTDGYLESGKLYYLDPRKIVILEGFNPRSTEWGDDEDKALEKYVKLNGTAKLPPVLVRHINDKFILTDGWRRLTATMKNIERGVEIVSIPAMLDDGDDLDAVYRAVNSNAGKPLTPLEEADAFSRAVNMGAKPADVAKRTGRSIQYVSQRLTLAKGDPEVLEMVAKKELAINAALTAIRQSSGDNHKQKTLAKAAVTKKAEIQQHAQELTEAITAVEKTEGIEFTSAEKKMYSLLDAHGVDGCLAMMVKVATAKLSVATDKQQTRKWQAALIALETAKAM